MELPMTARRRIGESGRLSISFRDWYSNVTPPILLFLFIDIAATLISFALSNPTVRIGALRPASTILPKVAELALVGVAVGLVSCIPRKTFDPVIVTLATAFVLFLDLDHLPSVFGVFQPIRPAHSLGFLLLVVGAFAIFFSGRPELELVFVSSFSAHLAADTGIFAPLAPVSFAYVSLDIYRLPLALGATLLALLSGYIRRQNPTL